jgi:hypothetical protein
MVHLTPIPNEHIAERERKSSVAFFSQRNPFGSDDSKSPKASVSGSVSGAAGQAAEAAKDTVSSITSGLKKMTYPSIGSIEDDTFTTTVYGSRFAACDLPKTEMPETEMPREVAYRMIKDDLSLDGNPMLNLASFVTTYMEKEAEDLMAEAFPKNFIDYEEYPMSADIQNRCVSMIARLFNAPATAGDTAIGTSTVGSSEAIMLGVLAMKKKWANKRRAEGKSTDRPNIVMNSAVQVCWEKAARYFEVEEKYVYCTEERYVIDPEEAVKLVDENTVSRYVALRRVVIYGLKEGANGGLTDRHLCHPRQHLHGRIRRHQAHQRPPSREEHRHGHPRRRRLRRLRRPLRRPRPGMGLSPRESREHQRLRPQIRTGLPRRRLGRLEKRRLPPQRTRLQHQLPRRRPSLLHAKLLQRRVAGHRAVLPAHPPRQARVQKHHDEPYPHGGLLE